MDFLKNAANQVSSGNSANTNTAANTTTGQQPAAGGQPAAGQPAAGGQQDYGDKGTSWIQTRSLWSFPLSASRLGYTYLWVPKRFE